MTVAFRTLRLLACNSICQSPYELPVGSRLEAGRLFEDIQERGRAVDSVALRIAYSFHDPRTFQLFDGALRGRKRDR